ncbi:hypothetical protein [Moraxella marmotae]|uniref:hypothetical protein n=1 Tax=Moraxella marmotae TaxID=3344520 RepID=UPI0035F30470
MSTENIFTNYPRWEQVKDIDASHAIDAAFKYAENQQKVWDNLNKEVQGVFDTAQAHKANKVQKVIDAMPVEVLNSPLSTDVINTLTTDAFKDIGGASAKTTAGILGYGDKRRDTLLDRQQKGLQITDNEFNINKKRDEKYTTDTANTLVSLSKALSQFDPKSDEYKTTSLAIDGIIEKVGKEHPELIEPISQLRQTITNTGTQLTVDGYSTQGKLDSAIAGVYFPQYKTFMQDMALLEKDEKALESITDKTKKETATKEFEAKKKALAENYPDLMKIMSNNPNVVGILENLLSADDFQSQSQKADLALTAARIGNLNATGQAAITTANAAGTKAEAAAAQTAFNISTSTNAAAVNAANVDAAARTTAHKAEMRGLILNTQLADKILGDNRFFNKDGTISVNAIITDFKTTMTGLENNARNKTGTMETFRTSPKFKAYNDKLASMGPDARTAFEAWLNYSGNKFTEQEKVWLAEDIADGVLTPYKLTGWTVWKQNRIDNSSFSGYTGNQAIKGIDNFTEQAKTRLKTRATQYNDNNAFNANQVAISYTKLLAYATGKDTEQVVKDYPQLYKNKAFGSSYGEHLRGANAAPVNTSAGKNYTGLPSRSDLVASLNQQGGTNHIDSSAKKPPVTITTPTSSWTYGQLPKLNGVPNSGGKLLIVNPSGR